MRKISELSLRRTFWLLTTAVAAVGVFLGLPMKKAVAAGPPYGMAPAATVNQPPASLPVVQPTHVNPNAATLVRIADQALSNNTLAERIFSQPDAVASQFNLSKNETLVLRQMTREQFQTARTDAAHVVATRLPFVAKMQMPPGATDARLITEHMIVGRAILAAVGRSYLNAANAHDCCPWNKSIELGINSDPAFYNAVFIRPAGANLLQPGTYLQH